MSVSSALAVASHAANIAGGTLSQALFGASRSIGEAAQQFTVNRQAVSALARRVEDFVVHASNTLDSHYPEGLGKDQYGAFSGFIEILKDIYVVLGEMQRRSYLSQFLHRERDSERVQALGDRLKLSFQVLMLDMQIDIQERLNTDIEEFHPTTLVALDAAMDIARKLQDSKAAAQPEHPHLLPPPPQYYMGRTAETCAAVDMLSSGSAAYIAVIGGPGMGKTSVAIAVLHAVEVQARYRSRRFFIACDTAERYPNLLSTVCASFGIPSSNSRLARKELGRVLGSSPSLIVLDNFESCWDGEGQQEAEDVLSYLGSIEGLSIFVTLRGSERPSGLCWTRPYLAPLSPLDDAAAIQLFASISDISDQEGALPQLLPHLGNVPLPITIMAYLAQSEPLTELIARWNEMKTSMLTRSHGTDRLTSLNISIELSLQSRCIQDGRGARELLSLLAMLPQGVHDSDIYIWAAALPMPARSLAALLQASLVYRASDSRIRVLAPIREFMLLRYPPTETTTKQLCTHYFGLAELFTDEDAWSGEDFLAMILPEVDNIYATIAYGLDSSTGTSAAAIAAAVHMITLFIRTGLGSFDLLPQALKVSRSLQREDLIADLLYRWARLASNSRCSGDPTALALEAESLYRSAGQSSGIILCNLLRSSYLPAVEAVSKCEDMCALAQETEDLKRLASCHHYLALAYERSSMMKEARIQAELAVDCLRSLGSTDYGLLGTILYRMADHTSDSGDVETAISQLQESIPLLQRVHRRNDLGAARTLLARAVLEQGHALWAVDLLESAMLDFRSGGFTRGEIWCSQMLVSAYIANGNLSAAGEVLRKADQIVHAPETGDRTYERAVLLQAKGEFALACGDLDDARATLHGALFVVYHRKSSLGAHSMETVESGVQVPLGRVEQAAGNVEEARARFLVTALISRKHAVVPNTVTSLARFGISLDDETASPLLGGLLLPLMRFQFRPLLAEVFLRLAEVAHYRYQRGVARGRATEALRLFGELECCGGQDRARKLLESITL
ncbi:hypothetical protein EXIGLDRAFT_319023 [Exidia glandulosa HHB12029]|uniref:AAA+ ATPase domain-containing protein n=1 Tax=Exidia glandulosa HHB12029 TaxID=1314781 RepID=A0A165Q3P9_EXIGL|nr:hypothetical protein EXIGLDRAFT_319023 [Exidia glandulosa HHB12029]